MLSSIRSKLPFALWLLIILVAINLVSGAVFLANVAMVESKAIAEARSERLEKTANLLQESVSSALSDFRLDRRREILGVLSPVIYSNPEIDLMGLFRLDHGWGMQSWTRAGGDGSLPDLFPPDSIKALIYSDSKRIEENGFLLMARPILQAGSQTGRQDGVTFLVVGQDLSLTWAELVPRIQNLSFQLALVVLAQTLAVSVFLNARVRRPVQQIINKTADVEDEHADLAKAFSDLGDLARIEKAIDLLRTSRTEYRQQEAYLRSILETMKEGILVLDEDANIVEVNQAFVSTWGYTLDDIKGEPIQTIFHPRHRPRYTEEINQYKESGEPLAPDVVEIVDAVDMNGREFPITYVYSEFLFGKERMFLVTVSDISDQERHKRELIEAKNMAELAAEAKAIFLANMSHEIRTPMNGVMGLLDLVGDTDLDSQQSSLVRTAKVSAESLLNVLNDILDISKIEAGKIDLEQTEFEIDSVLEEVVTLFHVAALDKGLELSCYIDPSLDRRVIGDPTRIRQIASNIIGNAVKFTHEGEVEVRVEVKAEHSDRYSVAIVVRDTGIGMSENALKTLFDPFSQGDSSTTRKFGGTGLGMAISRQLIELMDGKIEATSEPGVGTIFRVEMDLSHSAKREARYRNASQLPKTNILVVDDNATNRAIISAYLANWNIDFSVAKSVKDALDILEENDPNTFDICLTDYHMPDADGIDLARAIGDRNLAPSMMTALLSSSAAEVSSMREVGISMSINKPIRQKELFDLIARCRDVNLKQEEEVSEVEETLDGRVLLVEDNKVNQLVAQSLLEKLGLDVDVAVDGEKALDAMRKNEYDLILMDCLMPVMDGYQATKARRQYESENNLPRIPIVALTANAMSGDREKCLDAGMDDFLSKPIKLDDMKQKLQEWLSKRTVSALVAGE